MILAAGLGTRLGSLTRDVPKALIPVAGTPMLGWVIDAMVTAGVGRIIINTHRHHDQIRDFIKSWAPPDVTFVFSREPEGPLETGGGLIQAAPLFREGGAFLLHNADVLSTVPLGKLLEDHRQLRNKEPRRLVASLAVQHRASDRVLLFDRRGLMGWENEGSERAPEGRVEVREPEGPVSRYSFTGIHVVEPAIFHFSQRRGRFSIITLYLELAAAGWSILPLDVSHAEWYDVGTPERLAEARARFS